MIKKPVCPVDKNELKIDRSNSTLTCPDCNRIFYANLDYDNKQQETMNEYDDIEVASNGFNSGYGSGPLLLSSTHDKDDFVLKSETKQDPYEQVLKKRYGGHVNITTETNF